MTEHFDVVFVADPRFSGGTSTALIAEMQAAARAGVPNALIPVKSPPLKKCWPYHAGVRAELAAGSTALIEPGARVVADFAIVHHPLLLSAPLAEPINLEAETVVLVLHHPMKNGVGEIEYDLSKICAHLRDLFGSEPHLAPVGPLVAEQIERPEAYGAQPELLDWRNLIDVDAWARPPRRPDPDRIRIGRHSRPYAPKWPDTLDAALAAYPPHKRYQISMLGGAGGHLDRLYGAAPKEWELLSFGAIAPREYLHSLDFYVYHHSEKWVEAFGLAILEALSVGLPTILPKHFQKLFGDGALYAEPGRTADIVDALVADPEAYRLQCERAQSRARVKFGYEVFPHRLKQLRPDWAASAPARGARAAPYVAAPKKKRAMLMTSNGVGLGHITRMTAVAEKLADDVEPVFFTLSQGVKLLQEAGFIAEYRPSHRATGADVDAWNRALAEELGDAISFYGPDVFVFDGNVPYGGVLEAFKIFPALKTIWMRRAFWTEGHRPFLARASHFDAIIEPGDLAEAVDRGPTVSQRDKVMRVGPIIRHRPEDRASRDEARARLDLPSDKLVVAVALGSGSNFDLSEVRRAVVDHLKARGDVHIVELVSPIAAEPPAAEPDVRQMTVYPVFPLTNAFDAMVGACGYNSFHEALIGGVPTVFTPNEAPEMDKQAERALYGESIGGCLTLRRANVLATGRILDRILHPETRAAIRARAERTAPPDGAAEAAAYVRDYAFLRKARSALAF